RIRDMLRSAELLPILLHHRAEHLLARVDAESEERGAGVLEDIKQRQRQLHGGDGWGRELFPGDRSCATSLHGGSLPLWSQQPPSLPDGGRSRRSSFSPSVQQPSGHPQSVDVHVRRRLAVNDIGWVHEAARRGIGIALLPEFACKEDLQAGRLRQVLSEWSS